MSHTVNVPRINANEDEVLLAAWHVEAGQQVDAGDEICTLESTKSAETLTAESSGCVHALSAEEGDMVTVGAALCTVRLANDVETAQGASSSGNDVPDAAPRMTAKQRLLARQKGAAVSPVKSDVIDSGKLDWVVAARVLLAEEGAPSSFENIQSDLCYIAPGAQVSPDCNIRADRVYIGPAAKIGAGTTIDTMELIVGAGANIASEVIVDLAGGAHEDSRLLVGPISLIGSRSCINTCREVLLDKESAVSPGSYVFTHSFWQSVLDGYPVKFEPVRFAEKAWVGAGCQVLPGVHIGSGAIAISNSTVVEDVPPETMVGGVPAQILRQEMRRPLSAQAAVSKLEEIIELVRKDLVFKGCTRDGDSIVSPGGKTYSFSVADEMRITLQSHADEWIFDCSTGVFSGSEDRIAHELRNALRRYGIRFEPYEWDAGYRGPLGDA